MSDQLGPVVPAYFHPALAAEEWAALACSAHRLRLVVLNVANGAGEVPDHAFFDVVRDVQGCGAPVAGYVDSDYGRTTVEQVVAEMRSYWLWYGVREVFLDRAASGIEHLAHYARIAAACRGLGSQIVAFNHGTYPAREYALHADLLGTFEGALPAYLDQDVPRWVHDHLETQFFQLLYDTPIEVAGPIEALAQERNVGSLYRTERPPPNPWAGLPADFPATPNEGWPS